MCITTKFLTARQRGTVFRQTQRELTPRDGYEVKRACLDACVSPPVSEEPLTVLFAPLTVLFAPLTVLFAPLTVLFAPLDKTIAPTGLDLEVAPIAPRATGNPYHSCLLYTSDAADDLTRV